MRPRRDDAPERQRQVGSGRAGCSHECVTASGTVASAQNEQASHLLVGRLWCATREIDPVSDWAIQPN